MLVEELPRWATIHQTAEYISVDHKTIRRYIAEGRLSARRVGERLIRVDRDSVEKLMRPMGA